MNGIGKVALFIGGTLFGSAGFKILGSQDAKKAYVQTTAAALAHNASTIAVSLYNMTPLLPEDTTAA